jgi:hypothetical protein
MYDESESEPLTQPDTNNATKFHPGDADHDSKYRADGTATFEQHYSRLARLNTGVYNGKWVDEDKRARQDKLAIFDCLSGQLELTPYQKQEARREFDNLSVRDLSTPGGIDTTLVAVMVAAVVARRDGRMYHPQANEESNDALFLALLDDLGHDDESVLHSAFGKIHYRLEVGR